MNRRYLLSTVAVMALSGCAAGTASTTGTTSSLPSTIADLPGAVSTIFNDLNQFLGTLPGNLALGASGIVSQIGSIATQLASAVSGGPSSAVTSLVSGGSGLSGLLSSLLGAVGGTSALGGIGTFGTILQAGLQILPVILSIAGVALAGPPNTKAAQAAWSYLTTLAH